MASTLASLIPVDWTVADMLRHLGGIPPQRIRMYPPPGTATEQDVLDAKARIGRICELIDGVLVEKTMGYYESLLAGILIHLLNGFLETHPLGVVLGEAGTLRILPNQVRIPDVSFIRWERFPNRQLPREPIPAVAPDLAVEVLSDANTEAEMRSKLDDYFRAGVQLVWCIDPRSRTATVHRSADQISVVREDEQLDGGSVLPGFKLLLGDLFRRAQQQKE